MLISTRGRYALRVMIDLAETGGSGYVPMKMIAQRQGISLKYLERIIPVLKKHGIVEGVQGKGGGYRLCRSPQEYKVGEILRLTEGGSMAPVHCLSCDATPCERRGECRTIAMWNELSHLINAYLDGITIADLMHTRAIGNAQRIRRKKASRKGRKNCGYVDKFLTFDTLKDKIIFAVNGITLFY